MRIRLPSNWDWPVPGKRAVVAFPAGDYAVGVQDAPGDLLRMTGQQATDALASGHATDITPPPKRTARRGKVD